MMQVRWLRKALANLDQAADYIAQDNRAAAAAIVKEAFRLTDLLADNPNMGRPGRVPGTRELVMAHYPYIIPYRIRNGWVEVLRVFHAARRWPETL
jgi:toxin ParE1/3/4